MKTKTSFINRMSNPQFINPKFALFRVDGGEDDGGEDPDETPSDDEGCPEYEGDPNEND